VEIEGTSLLNNNLIQTADCSAVKKGGDSKAQTNGGLQIRENF